MTYTIEAQLNILDPVSVLNSFGTYTLLGLLLLVFVESGLLFPFLPGDSLLFTAGLIAANKSADIEPFASLPTLLITVTLAAFIGSEIGYWLGAKFGYSLFKPNAKILKTEYIEQTHTFFEKYGPLTVVIARFVPIVRTFAPIAAGIAKMRYATFSLFNLIGAVTWVFLVTLAGYFLGNISFVREHIEAIFIFIVLVSVLPVILGIIKKYLSGRIDRNKL